MKRLMKAALDRLLRKLTLLPVSFTVELDGRELDRYLMEPGSRSTI